MTPRTRWVTIYSIIIVVLILLLVYLIFAGLPSERSVYSSIRDQLTGRSQQVLVENIWVLHLRRDQPASGAHLSFRATFDNIHSRSFLAANYDNIICSTAHTSSAAPRVSNQRITHQIVSIYNMIFQLLLLLLLLLCSTSPLNWWPCVLGWLV